MNYIVQCKNCDQDMEISALERADMIINGGWAAHEVCPENARVQAFLENLKPDIVVEGVGPSGRALSATEALSLLGWWKRRRKQQQEDQP